jgi:hypothetical protein
MVFGPDGDRSFKKQAEDIDRYCDCGADTSFRVEGLNGKSFCQHCHKEVDRGPAQ